MKHQHAGRQEYLNYWVPYGCSDAHNPSWYQYHIKIVFLLENITMLEAHILFVSDQQQYNAHQLQRTFR